MIAGGCRVVRQPLLHTNKIMYKKLHRKRKIYINGGNKSAKFVKDFVVKWRYDSRQIKIVCGIIQYVNGICYYVELLDVRKDNFNECRGCKLQQKTLYIGERKEKQKES